MTMIAGTCAICGKPLTEENDRSGICVECEDESYGCLDGCGHSPDIGVIIAAFGVFFLIVLAFCLAEAFLF